jgi:hypothetical protein
VVAVGEETRSTQARGISPQRGSHLPGSRRLGPGQGHIRRESQLCPSQPRRSGRCDVIAPMETARGHRPRREDPAVCLQPLLVRRPEQERISPAAGPISVTRRSLRGWRQSCAAIPNPARIGHYERVLRMLGARPMTDDAVRDVRSGDGQVAYRVVGSGPSVAWVPGLLRVRRHDRDYSRVSSRRPGCLVPCRRAGHRDAIEETWGRGAALRWMKRSPRASTHF